MMFKHKVNVYMYIGNGLERFLVTLGRPPRNGLERFRVTPVGHPGTV